MAAIIMVWANIATGDEPDIDGAVELAATLLEASEGVSRAPARG
jgi:hypothetical protein